MSKLKLVIADSDRDYLESLVRFILINYPDYFELHSFSKPAFLCDYIRAETNRIDILLMCEKFNEEYGNTLRPEVTVLLSEEKVPEPGACSKSIFKYQHAEKIMAELVEIYSEISGCEFTPAKRGSSKIAAVFSGTGGSGKTCFAVCSSIVFARQGARVLYLNLESINSSSSFFSCDSTKSLSNVIYYLKDNTPNLVSRLEGARCMDPDTGVFYYPPADRIQDVEELQYEDTELLVAALKKAACYDYIFIDLPGALTPRTLAILKAADVIALVESGGMAARAGNIRLEREFELLRQVLNVDVKGKCRLIQNKVQKYDEGIHGSNANHSSHASYASHSSNASYAGNNSHASYASQCSHAVKGGSWADIPKAGSIGYYADVEKNYNLKALCGSGFYVDVGGVAEALFQPVNLNGRYAFNNIHCSDSLACLINRTEN